MDDKATEIGNPFMTELDRLRKRMEMASKILAEPLDTETGQTPKDTVYEEDKLKLYHYKPVKENLYSPPILGIYALINKQYMMDLQPDRSMVKYFLEQGIDVYLIDWGYASRGDRFITMEDYIDGYINNCVDFIREKHGIDTVTLFGICQGGTFSMIYSSLYPEKVKNLITMVTPMDFHTDKGLLNIWSNYMDIDKMVDTYGNIPGDFMNAGFLLMNPFRLMFDKYLNFLENLDDKDFISNFIRMEKWIFDSPDQAGEAFRKFLKDMYQHNKLVKGEFELDGRKVDLKNIKIPLLNVFARWDHLVPPPCSENIAEAVGSKDKTTHSFKTGHIGMFTGSRSRKEVCPIISDWLKEHSTIAGKPAKK
ncbi:MAG: class III poly(R)-hydroxyalkanoic acid synthase subunit PhaC [Planctomycetota bacterium]